MKFTVTSSSFQRPGARGGNGFTTVNAINGVVNEDDWVSTGNPTLTLTLPGNKVDEYPKGKEITLA